MDKTVNLLSYLPGHAGHFISIILSIDPSTFLPSRYPDQTTVLQELSFKNVRWKHGSWGAFHRSYSVEPWDAIAEFLQSEKKQYTSLFHPSKRDKVLTCCNNHSGRFNIKWLQVEVSKDFEFVINDFKKRNGAWPRETLHDTNMYIKIKSEFNPYIINLDNILLGTDEFTFEYKKLCDHLELPYHLDKVLPYYNDWYFERRIHFYNLKNGGPTRI